MEGGNWLTKRNLPFAQTGSRLGTYHVRSQEVRRVPSIPATCADRDTCMMYLLSAAYWIGLAVLDERFPYTAGQTKSTTTVVNKLTKWTSGRQAPKTNLEPTIPAARVLPRIPLPRLPVQISFSNLRLCTSEHYSTAAASIVVIRIRAATI
ncbi:hypothetical protein BDW71DRAFT_135097 [Aspergillus fruticulosus]